MLVKLTKVSYNVRSENVKVSALDEWHDSLHSIVEVVIAKP